jgi:hypothetical protein
VNFSDPGFQGAIVGAVAGLVGAMIGGAVTYWAAKTQYTTEYSYKKWDALRAVLIELCHNQASLYRDLDRSLPAWLARSHRRGGDAALERIKKFVLQSRQYETLVYDRLFSELIATKFGSELASYYRRLNWLNGWTSKPQAIDIDHDFDSYTFALANSILLADDLIRAIIIECRQSPVQSWGKNLDIEEFKASRQGYLFGAELAKYDLHSIEEFVQHGTRPNYFPDILANSDVALFIPYVAAAKECLGWG